MKHSYRLIFDCPDRVGIVQKVSEVITQHEGWISEAAYHSDTTSNWFFARIVVNADSLPFGVEEFRDKFKAVGKELNMNWRIVDTSKPKKVILMASKGSHCLSDLLDRWQNDELPCDIACVISNHDKMRELTEFYGIKYHHVPIEKDNKKAGFDEVERLTDEYRPDSIVLARYMQIIPPALCEKFKYQLINIHHSFLPSFIGARPYHQASKRGVKIIGATSHYVTEQLDEGPIIDQDVVRVSHGDSVEDLIRLGRDIEKIVLARGVRAHLEDRVLVHDNKTIVFK